MTMAKELRVCVAIEPSVRERLFSAHALERLHTAGHVVLRETAGRLTEAEIA